VKLFSTTITRGGDESVEPQDIIDALGTLRFDHKIVTNLPPPGKGPEFFLVWAKDELTEAKNAAEQQSKMRKCYNAAVYAKAAVECLVDWYLRNLLLDFTTPRFAGAAMKLEALDAENLLGISFSLFNDIVFSPRNRGIHDYELVEEKEAVHAYELAALTVRNCVHHVCPSDAALIYGTPQIFRGDEALALIGWTKPTDEMDVFCFNGIGKPGSHAVLLDRSHPRGRVTLLSVETDTSIHARHCEIRQKCSSAELRTMLKLLERDRPQLLPGLAKDEIKMVTDALLSKS
jgi:hypothetical protein